MRMIPFIVLMFVGLLLMSVLGCNALQPNALPREFGATAKQIGTSITEKASWEDVLARVDGQVIEPGIEAYFRQEYVVGSRLVGFSGQVRLEGDGSATGDTSDAARAAILGYGQNPDVLEKYIEYLRAVEVARASSAAGAPATPGD